MKSALSKLLPFFVSLCVFCGQSSAQDAPKKTDSGAKLAAKPAEPQRAPTQANVAYGTHERQVLDFYRADSATPTPVVFHIHGGGWVAGDKKVVAALEKYLAAGISVVSINYRYSTQAQIAGVKPPVEWPIADAARALQFVRSKGKEWNLDKQRIGATGGSAGACSSLWLAFHPDLVDAKSLDPVARESSRLWCAAVSGAQTSLDPKELKDWTPNSRYGGHAFGFMPDPRDNKTRDTQFAAFLAGRESVLPWIKKYSPMEHVSSDDPPIWMIYSSAPALGQEQKDPTHTANYGVKLQEKCKATGVPCELVYPGAPDVRHAKTEDFLIATLKAKR
ncbi:MAG: alpha/beta hydrolase [Verrucomicrobia bacterium]|nr:alpha/beta hydrolase [Verrucomicrobiota bacterium]